MCQLLLRALALSVIVLSSTQTLAFSQTASSVSSIPLGSETPATIACGHEERLEILPTTAFGNRQGGYERLTTVCQQRTTGHPLTSQPIWETVRTTIFFCAVPGEYVYPLYTESSARIKCICLPPTRPEKAAPDTSSHPSPIIDKNHVPTGVRHLRRNKIYTVRCLPGEELTSWRTWHNARWYYHVTCETNEGKKRQERYISCQWPTSATPENLVAPSEEDGVAHYVCLRPRRTDNRR